MAKVLLEKVAQIINHEKKIRKIKGEDFNIFSILNMEYNETSTHSAFIAELLNPKGRHHMNDVFLKLFLEVVFSNEENQRDEIDKILSRHVQVKTEHHISQINYENITGGRIDILLKYGDSCISIENKIYAGDQKNQLERYYNFNPGKNTVLYLTLDGKIASTESYGNLKESDYKCISYSYHIKNWLEECLKYTADQAILRESIKQYLILIKKLTHQMDDTSEKELQQAILSNLEAADIIAHNYEKTKNIIKDEFRDYVIEKLRPITEKYNLEVWKGDSIESKHAQIWITPHNNRNPVARFGIESFSGDKRAHHSGRMMYGIWTRGGDEKVAKEIEPECYEWFWWPVWEWVFTEAENHLNLSSLDLLKRMRNEEYKNKQADIIVDNMAALFEKYANRFIEVSNKYNQL
jgi:hypothetical protein